MEKGLEERFVTNLEKRAKKTVASLALVTALNLTPISTEQKNDPNIGVPNTSTISLSLENKAYASSSEAENNKELYVKLSYKFPEMFLKSFDHNYIIKKIDNKLVAINGMAIVAEYENGDWQNLPENTIFRPDNQKQSMVENLENLMFPQSFGNNVIENPFGISKEDIEEYKNTGKTDLKSFTIISNPKGEPRLVIANKGFDEYSLKTIKEGGKLINEMDPDLLDKIVLNNGLRIVAGEVYDKTNADQSWFAWFRYSRGLLQFRPEGISKLKNYNNVNYNVALHLIVQSQRMKEKRSIVKEPNGNIHSFYVGLKTSNKDGFCNFARGVVNGSRLAISQKDIFNWIIDEWEK